MKKTETALFFKNMDQLIALMDDDDNQKKMEFAKYFMLNKMGIDVSENSKISLNSMNVETFKYLIFSIILEYESMRGKL